MVIVTVRYLLTASIYSSLNKASASTASGFIVTGNIRGMNNASKNRENMSFITQPVMDFIYKDQLAVIDYMFKTPSTEPFTFDAFGHSFRTIKQRSMGLFI